MTLLKNDGPYLQGLLSLNHPIDVPGHTWADCDSCQQANALRPGPEDFVFCALCGCCSLSESEDGTIVCFGGCNLADGKHEPIEQAATA